MYQTLYYIPDKIAGYQTFGLGLAFTIWLVVSVVGMALLVRYQGWNDNTRSYLPILLLVGLGILFLAPFLIEEKLGLPIRGYGVMVTLGVVAGVGLSAWQARRMGLDPEVIFSLAFWMFAAGIGGARLFFVLNNLSEFQNENTWDTVKEIANFTKGGLVVYGSVVGGLAALVVFCGVRKLPLLAIGDLIAPGMLVGLAFGRIGCLLNGCCYGGVCEGQALPAISFPRYADERAKKESDPFLHQQSLGLLHGFRLGPGEDGLAVVTVVRPDSPAGRSGLAVGAVIKRIDLDSANALNAAERISELAGRELEVETADGDKLAVPIVPGTPLKGGGWSLNDVGFSVEDHGQDGVFVESVTAGGPAAQAGLKPAEKLKAIHLAELPSLAAARGILIQAKETIVLEAGDGTRYDVSLPELPKRSRPVHPSQIYSTIKASLLAFFLWSYYPFRRRDGEVFAFMLTLYPLFRILLESIRDDTEGLWGTPITFSQAVSGVILLVAAGLWIHLFRQPTGSVLPPREPVVA